MYTWEISLEKYFIICSIPLTMQCLQSYTQMTPYHEKALEMFTNGSYSGMSYMKVIVS